MRKKVAFAVGAAALTLLLSSCFVLQGFIVLDYTLTPTQTTKARLTLRPSNFDNQIGPPATGPQYEFVIIGVSDSGDLSAQTARWGTTGTFGGPLVMTTNGALIAAIGSGCGSNGINLQDLTGFTFKAYVTPIKIGDGAKYEKKAIVDVGIKAQADATPGDEWTVVGIAGEWVDDGDDTPDGGDFYSCHGIGSSLVHIKAG
jgi:hypothetical protein